MAEIYDELDAAERGLAAPDVGEDDSEAELEFESNRRSTRERGSRNKQKRLAALDKFKQRRAGIVTRDEEDEDEAALYDVVDEEQYQKIREARLQEDEFIVDDGDDHGYRDHGGEIWDEVDAYEGGESEAAHRAKRVGTGVRRPAVRRVPKRRVNSLFTGGGRSNRLGASVVKMSADNNVAGDDDFLASVLAEADEEQDMEIDLEQEAARERKRKKKSNLAHLAMFGSTAEARNAFLDGPIPEEEEPVMRKKISKTIGGSDAGSPPSRRGGVPKSRQFTSPEQQQDGIMEHNDDFESHMDDLPDDMQTNTEQPNEKEKEKLSSPKKEIAKPEKKKKKVVQMMTEEDLEALENAKDGAKDHLKVTKPVLETEDWKKVRRSTAEEKEVKIDSSKLPLMKLENGDEILRFFWLDAYEGEKHKAGSVYLFGKVALPDSDQFVSCCVTVENTERNVFFLPRDTKLDKDGHPTDEEVTFADVYTEVDEILTKAGIKKFQSKPVERKYAFEKHDVPAEGSWLKVKYSAAFPKLPDNIKGKTFSHVFGAGIGPLERFLMKRNLMGPCWLDIKLPAPSSRSVSWCKIEAVVDDAKNIKKTENPPVSPPLVVLSLNMQTILNRKTCKNEILVMSGLVHNKIQCDGPTKDPNKDFTHFTAVRQLGAAPFPFDFRPRCHQSGRKDTMELCMSERALLGYVMAKIAKIDPDVIVGHNILGFDLDVLLHRIKANNIPHWSRIGRYRRTVMPKLQHGAGGRANYAERVVASGRLLVDVQISAREFVRQTSYDLTELVKTQLQAKRVDVDAEFIPQMFNQSETLLQLCDTVERDAWFIMHLMLKLLVIPLSKQITNITGGLLCRTFSGGRSERNEYLLCHEFHRRKFIVPDKRTWQPKSIEKKDDGDDDDDGSKKQKKKKAAYSGGLVLEPKKGFYDKYILLLDFNSLYPSIIQEYNLCFTTVARNDLGQNEDGHEAIADIPDSNLETGVLPRVLSTLIAKRKAVKELIKKETNPSKLADYDIRQKALKLTANSMYGCLGFTASRFYAKPIAALITAKGREILQKTVDLAQDSLNLDVIYGDTDSIMINTRCTDLKEVKKIGNMVKKEVNGLYKLLEIEIDGVFKTMLLLKKKKYAALTIEEKNGEVTVGRETKGLDIVRRDWCKFSHDVGSYVLNQILSRESREDLVDACHEYLRGVAEDVNNERVPIEKYIIHKGLTKDPSHYSDKKSQPHVQVALRMIAAGKSVKQHDTVPFVVCNDGTTNSPTMRAYHPDDLRKNMELTIDTVYYLKNQIHPVVSRLLDPIDGTDSAQIADCLGLNPDEFRGIHSSFDPLHNDIGMGMMTQMSDEERFKGVEKLTLSCRKCGNEEELTGVFRTVNDELRCGLLCTQPSCSGKHEPAYLCNKLTLLMRHHIDQYYLSELKCDDEACAGSEKLTRQLSVKGTECLDPYCRGNLRPIYPDKKLYTQLSYYEHLFDIEKALKKVTESNKILAESIVAAHRETFKKAFNHVSKQLEMSAFQHVDLGSIFSRLGLK
eukprot:m.145616 g.145616  ORF g.145616 m.145616 type:complete len:1518 (-) comp14951_c0_seq3:205-4758(-)